MPISLSKRQAKIVDSILKDLVDGNHREYCSAMHTQIMSHIDSNVKGFDGLAAFKTTDYIVSEMPYHPYESKEGDLCITKNENTKDFLKSGGFKKMWRNDNKFDQIRILTWVIAISTGIYTIATIGGLLLQEWHQKQSKILDTQTEIIQKQLNNPKVSDSQFRENLIKILKDK